MVSARPSEFEKFRRTIEQANKLRERVDHRAGIRAERIRQLEGRDANEQIKKARRYAGQAAWERYLRAHDMKVATNRSTYQFDMEPDGPSTQAISPIDHKGVDATMSITYNNYTSYYYAEISFQLYMEGPDYDTEIEYDYGEAPMDTVGLGWKDICWERHFASLQDGTSTSSNVTLNTDSYTTNGLGAEVDDAQMWEEWKNQHTISQAAYTDTEFFGIYMDSEKGSNNECDVDSDTKVLGIYDHTWSGTFSGFDVSVGLPLSISIKYEGSTPSHDYTRTGKNDEYPLEVTLGDAELIY